MKNKIRTFLACVGTIVMSSCTGWLDVPNNDMISSDGFLDTDAEIEAYIAGLYDDLPIEDFMYYFSTGEFRFPQKKAAEIAVRTVMDYLNTDVRIERVVFNVFKHEDYDIYRQLIG